MGFSLERHIKGYGLTFGEFVCLSLGPLSPYATRHWEIGGCNHTVMAITMSLPGVGFVAALVELVALAAKKLCSAFYARFLAPRDPNAPEIFYARIGKCNVPYSISDWNTLKLEICPRYQKTDEEQTLREKRTSDLADPPESFNWVPKKDEMAIALQKMVENTQKALISHQFFNEEVSDSQPGNVAKPAEGEQREGVAQSEIISPRAPGEAERKDQVSRSVPSLHQEKEVKAFSSRNVTKAESSLATQLEFETALAQLGFNQRTLSFQSKIASEKTEFRKQMEDVHFRQQLENGGTIYAVLDGHGDAHGAAAIYMSTHFPKKMTEYLRRYPSDPKAAFECAVFDLDKQMESEKIRDGCTSVISYVTPTGLMFTATTGDCGVTVYRKTRSKYKAYPLSTKLEWWHHEEALRIGYDTYNRLARNPVKVKAKDLAIKKVAQTAYFEFAQHAPEVNKEGSIILNKDFTAQLEKLRYNDLNITRAHGDFDSRPYISGMPIVTVFQLEDSDYVLWGSDGLRDHVTNKQVIGILNDSQPLAIPNKVCEAAKAHMKDTRDGDNITAIGMLVTGKGRVPRRNFKATLKVPMPKPKQSQPKKEQPADTGDPLANMGKRAND